MQGSQSHVDDAEYVEQSGQYDQLTASLAVDNEPDPPHLLWTCPVCRGAKQRDEITVSVIVGIDREKYLPPIDVVCHCGHAHGDNHGCGYGAQVSVPVDLIHNKSE